MRKTNSTNYENQKTLEETCGLSYAMDLLKGRWTTNVLWAIHLGANRYGLLKNMIPGISEKMLTQRLRDLQKMGLIIRKDFKKVPPHVEYSLSSAGEAFSPIFQVIYDWGDKVRPITKSLIAK